jgi:GNAT superfamily N-acetyltransferase
MRHLDYRDSCGRVRGHRVRPGSSCGPYHSGAALRDIVRISIHTVQRSDWRDYRQIRLAALKDSPSAFASTWQEEASLASSQWKKRARRSEHGQTLTIVAAVDDAGHWVGLAGGYRPGGQGADAELISMWVVPECRGLGLGPELVRAVVVWAEGHRASIIGLWVNEACRPAISLYENAGFSRTGEVDKFPSDPTQQAIRMQRGFVCGYGASSLSPAAVGMRDLAAHSGRSRPA